MNRRGMPSPGGQASGMAATAVNWRYEVGAPGAIPTTSRRATRPPSGGTRDGLGRRFRRQVPPHGGPVGLRQVDGMTPRSRKMRDCRTLSNH